MSFKCLSVQLELARVIICHYRSRAAASGQRSAAGWMAHYSSLQVVWFKFGDFPPHLTH